jgi:hypothetical protein
MKRYTTGPGLLVAGLATVFVAACGGGPPSPPALAYGEQTVSAAAYAYSDTTSVRVSVMGQTMELSQHGIAEYDVVFDEAPSGVDVLLSVRSLSASLNQPMGPPVRVDESMVVGDLVFTLSRVGDPTVTRRPEVSDEASQMVSGLSLAHSFFPALPGRTAVPGESWVDSLDYSGEDGPGVRSETSVLRYTVVGDTVVGGRSLLHIEVAGTATVSNAMVIAGMDIDQASDLDVSGYVLWDLQAGIPFEHYRESTGTGQVRIPISPFPLPIEVRSTQRSQLKTP